MGEVIIAGAWKGKIVDIDRRLSEVREELQKRFDIGLERIEKSNGKVSRHYLNRLYKTYKELKQIDRALEGRFNIIIVA